MPRFQISAFSRQRSAENGFSLIETLVAIGVIAVIGFIMTELLFRTLKTGSKTELIGVVKNNGDKAISAMSNTIQFSDRVICVSSDINGSVIVTYQGGHITRFSYIPPSNGNNGKLQQESFTLPDPAQINQNNGNYLCDLSNSIANPDPNPIPVTAITDTDTLTGVSVQATPSQPIFKLIHVPGYKDQVSINFTLFPGAGVGSGFQNQIGASGQAFSTSVELR